MYAGITTKVNEYYKKDENGLVSLVKETQAKDLFDDVWITVRVEEIQLGKTVEEYKADIQSDTDAKLAEVESLKATESTKVDSKV